MVRVRRAPRFALDVALRAMSPVKVPIRFGGRGVMTRGAESVALGPGLFEARVLGAGAYNQ